jgi:threonyl-tRNA synthetase
MLIVGEQEMAENALSARKHGGEDLGKLSLPAFIQYFKSQLGVDLSTN